MEKQSRLSAVLSVKILYSILEPLLSYLNLRNYDIVDKGVNGKRT